MSPIALGLLRRFFGRGSWSASSFAAGGATLTVTDLGRSAVVDRSLTRSCRTTLWVEGPALAFASSGTSVVFDSVRTRVCCIVVSTTSTTATVPTSCRLPSFRVAASGSGVCVNGSSFTRAFLGGTLCSAAPDGGTDDSCTKTAGCSLIGLVDVEADGPASSVDLTCQPGWRT